MTSNPACKREKLFSARTSHVFRLCEPSQVITTPPSRSTPPHWLRHMASRCGCDCPDCLSTRFVYRSKNLYATTCAVQNFNRHIHHLAPPGHAVPRRWPRMLVKLLVQVASAVAVTMDVVNIPLRLVSRNFRYSRKRFADAMVIEIAP